MQEREKTVSRADVLANLIIDMEYGTVIHYQDIESVVKQPRKTQKYYNAIQKAKKLAESEGKAIKPIGGGDYQVIYPGDYAKEYVREIRIAKNRIKHGDRILKAAPVGEMTSSERSTYNNVCDFNARMQAQFSGNYVEVRSLVGKRKHPFVSAAENA